MHSFHYQNSQLFCENVALSDIAEVVGTPTYIYSKETLRNHFLKIDQALSEIPHTVAYAVKANSNVAILKELAQLGAGFDIVSGGELHRVQKAGGDVSKTTFAGVGKTPTEIAYAIELGIHAFNCESIAEMEAIDSIAKGLGKIAPVSVRVNPNVDAHTHKYISTGKAENKFGVDFEDVEALYDWASLNLKNISLRGIQMHIGSQLTSVDPFFQAVSKIVPLARKLKEKHGIEFLSIGGGIGIVYADVISSGSPDWWKSSQHASLTIEEYANTLVPLLKETGLHIVVEPGRLIVGNAGILLSRCLYEKKGKVKTFKIVDAGMNDLIRPALYQGHHEIVAEKLSGENPVVADIVGPICETGDFFAQDRLVEDFHAGDLIALLSAGAYGASMASNYNTRPLPAEVLVDGDSWKVIRKRQTIEDILSLEIQD